MNSLPNNSTALKKYFKAKNEAKKLKMKTV